MESHLSSYTASDVYPFHMPGHKRIGEDGNADGWKQIGGPDGNASRAKALLGAAMQLDVTEVHGMDDLHHPTGILKEEMDAAASLYGTSATLFSVNGSTASILSAIFSSTKIGDKILAATNCHRSVYHAIRLRGLWQIDLPVVGDEAYDDLLEEATEERFLDQKKENGGSGGYEEGRWNIDFPWGMLRDRGPVDPEMVERAFREDPDIRCVVITSPTYDGILSDIARIAKIVHAHEAVLIVDEAHGAHLPFLCANEDAGGADWSYTSALYQGADLVIHSLHKTLPALTQTSLLHNVTGLVPTEELRSWMDVFVTSSPSYVLMASITSCLHFLEREKKDAGHAFAAYLLRLESFYRETRDLGKLVIYRAGTIHEPSKILIGTGTSGLDGPQLADICREQYGLETELAMPDYVLAMTGVCDTEEGFRRLSSALHKIDGQG